MGVKITRVEETKRQLRAFADRLSDDALGRKVLRAAVFPLMQAIKRNLKYHRVTGLTEIDISIVDMPDSEPGVVRVAVGGTGGKGGRGYIMTFLENGTSHNKAYPTIRPAWDSERPLLTRRIASELKARLGLKGGKAIYE